MKIGFRLYRRTAARGGPFSTLTTKRFTGQYHEAALGLYFYGARWYDPLLGRFTQADTLIPDPSAPQAFNRYAYTLNNPLRFTDPSGHRWVDSPDDTDNSNNSGGGGHHGGGGRHGSGGRGFPWWLYVKPPSIYDIKAGGNYDAGILKYGTRNLSVYVPPRVRYYPGSAFLPPAC